MTILKNPVFKVIVLNLHKNHYYHVSFAFNSDAFNTPIP